jgi:hypothetical protein
MSSAAVLGFIEPGLVINDVVSEDVQVNGEVRRDALQHPGESYICHSLAEICQQLVTMEKHA